jgi:hypothetical protein
MQQSLSRLKALLYPQTPENDDNPLAGGPPGDDPFRDYLFGDDPLGDDPSDDDPSVDDPFRDYLFGDDPLGDDSSDDDPSEDDPSGDDPSGDDPSGDDSLGDDEPGFWQSIFNLFADAGRFIKRKCREFYNWISSALVRVCEVLGDFAYEVQESVREIISTLQQFFS